MEYLISLFLILGIMFTCGFLSAAMLLRLFCILNKLPLKTGVTAKIIIASLVAIPLFIGIYLFLKLIRLSILLLYVLGLGIITFIILKNIFVFTRERFKIYRLVNWSLIMTLASPFIWAGLIWIWLAVVRPY